MFINDLVLKLRNVYIYNCVHHSTGGLSVLEANELNKSYATLVY